MILLDIYHFFGSSFFFSDLLFQLLFGEHVVAIEKNERTWPSTVGSVQFQACNGHGLCTA